MKVIDLLNMISKGKEVPTPIRFRNDCYDFDDGDYFNRQHRRWIFNDNDISGILNDEVAIIEEDKKIEKLPPSFYENACLTQQDRDIAKKINEIIDKINKMEEK